MFGPNDRPKFEDTFGWLNERHTQNGPVVGRITARNYQTHRVDVFLSQYGITLRNIRFAPNWTGGPGVGTINLPPIGAEVQVNLKQGKTGGTGQAEVIYANYSTDTPPPSHPSLKGEEDYYAFQGQTGIEDDTSPGTLEFFDSKGGKHTLAMGKQTHQSQGAADTRDKGLSTTQSEDHALKASNATALANRAANNLDSTDLLGMSHQLKSISNTLGSASRSAANAGAAYHAATANQASALAIGNNATLIASGIPNPDSIVSNNAGSLLPGVGKIVSTGGGTIISTGGGT